MSTEETAAIADLGIRIDAKAGAWTIRVKALGLEATGDPGVGLDQPARHLHAITSDRATGLRAVRQMGYLMAEGRVELARIETLHVVLSRFVTPEAGTETPEK